jgi:hypothetical protein
MTNEQMKAVLNYQKETLDFTNESIRKQALDEMEKEQEEVDKKIDRMMRADIINNYNEGMTAKEIANQLEARLDYVEQVIGEQEAKYAR